MKIPTADVTYETLAIDDTHEDDVRGGENAYTRDLVMDWFCVTMNVSEMHNATTITEFSIDV